MDRRAVTAGLAVLALLASGDTRVPAAGQAPTWSVTELASLRAFALSAPEDALPLPDLGPLDAAIRSGNMAAVREQANALALHLAQMHLRGVAGTKERAEWYIADPDRTDDLPARIDAALAENRIEAFFSSLRPASPDYAALRAALAREGDPDRRQTLARNMERWRWMPRDLGADYVLANAAAFDVALWRGGQRIKTWRAISGRTSTQTPSIAANATAINFNPWWEVPPSIAAAGGMSARRGFIHNGKRYRQKPGPGNALGQMKVVMYNTHNIYLHDTPSRGLFGAESRAFSHGCIRVDDAVGFAMTLIDGQRTRKQIDEKLAKPDSFVVMLDKPLPVYVTYFTASLMPDGSLAYAKDIYKRDAAILAVKGGSLPALAVR